MQMQPTILYNAFLLAATESLRLSLSQYSRYQLWLYVSALNGAPATASLTITVEQKTPQTGAVWVTVASIPAVTHGTALPHQAMVDVPIPSGECRVTATLAFTGGAAPSFTVTLFGVASVD